MSETDIQSIEHTLSELEQRILAKVGKWAYAIIGTCIMLTVGASSQWFGLSSRVDRLETWKADRAIGIDQYNQFRENLEGRLSKIETVQARQGEDIREILQLLKRQP